MPPSNRGSGTNPFLQPKRQAKPSTAAKQVAVFAAEQNLKPWELPQGRGKPAKAKPAPLDTRYKAAVAAPVDAPVKVGNKKVPARQYLAGTETPKRRVQYERIIAPPVPRPDRSFLHALLATPTSVYQHGVEPVLHAAGYTAKQATGQGTYKDRPFLEDLGIPAKAFVGNSLTNAVTHGQTSHLGAAGLEAAALFPPFKGLRALKFLRKAEEVAKSGEAATAQKVYYHVASKSQRENIAREGLQDKLTGKGVFLWDNPEDAAAYQKLVGGDVYHVKTKGLELKPDPWWDEPGRRERWPGPGQSFVSEKPIPQSNLTRVTEAEQAGKQIIGGMSQATRMRREQEALRHLERGVRATAAAKAMEEIPGEAGHIAALEALKGPMPTLKWDRFEHLDQDAVDAMIAHIRAHPSLQGVNKTYTRLNTEGALLSIVQGNLPRKFEQKLLRDVFGDATDRMLASVPFWKKAKAAGLNLLGVPRTLLASFDLSAPLRQGLLFGVSHPRLWGKNFPAMVKSFGSPRVYEETMQQIASRPTFDLMEKAKVPFTDLGGALSHREEMFMSNYAERIPGIGHIVKGSNRAYTAFLNKSRADYFDYLLEQATKAGHDPEDEKMLRGFARLVGNATGRGTVKNETLNKALPALNQILFAPRLLKSRLDVFNPGYYTSLDPLARKEAFKQLAGLVGTLGAVIGLAKLAGAKVQNDPRSADWTKIRVGNTRFDIAGGFQQPLRTLAQVASGKVISSTTGKSITLGAGGGYGHLTKLDILARFGETKLAPPPSFVIDFFRGSDFEGKPFSWKAQTYQRLTPLLAQDAISLYQQGDNTAGNIAAATALYGIGMWGIGAQTYGPTKPKPKASKDPFATPGTNPFLSSSSGSSNPFLSP